MDILRLVENHTIVSPRTHTPLRVDRNMGVLVSEDGAETYPLHDRAVPILVDDPQKALSFAVSSQNMDREYSWNYLQRKQVLLGRVKSALSFGIASKESQAAYDSIFGRMKDDSVCIDIGGGPNREQEGFINLNIAPYPNVDIVGNAYRLPFATSSVDAVHCNAVLEHLDDPSTAASEMFRVMKPGSKGYICTPFLQGFHGYPEHYQNFTFLGQRRVFEKAGFVVTDGGVCVGPMAMIVGLVSQMFRDLVPSPINKGCLVLWQILTLPLRPLDLLLNRLARAQAYASIQKP